MKYKYKEEYNMWWLFLVNAEMYNLIEAFKFTQER